MLLSTVLALYPGSYESLLLVKLHKVIGLGEEVNHIEGLLLPSSSNLVEWLVLVRR